MREEAELGRALREAQKARAEVLDKARTLGDRDLGKGLGGAWTVRTVFDHLVLTDGGNAAEIAHRKDANAPGADESYGRLMSEAPHVRSAADAVAALQQGRDALLAACDEIAPEGAARA